MSYVLQILVFNDLHFYSTQLLKIFFLHRCLLQRNVTECVVFNKFYFYYKLINERVAKRLMRVITFKLSYSETLSLKQIVV